MKKTIGILIFTILSINLYSQISINGGIDPKLAIFGTDNEFTTHDKLLNIHFKGEYHGRDGDIYFAIGAEYANLKQKYLAWFLNAGVPIDFEVFNIPFVFTPQLEFGDIFREHVQFNQYDSIKWDDTYYYGVNIPIRYYITDKFGIEIEGSIDRASDLPKREWRYGGKLSIIVYIFGEHNSCK